MLSYRSAFFAAVLLAIVLETADSQRVDELVLAPMDPSFAAGFMGQPQAQTTVQHYDPGSGNPHPNYPSSAKSNSTEVPSMPEIATEAPVTVPPTVPEAPTLPGTDPKGKDGKASRVDLGA